MNLPTAYRPCVGMMLFHKDRQRVFVARRIDTRAEAWQMPQGGIDGGESPEDALFREMHEEIGTDKAVVLAQSKDWLSYDLPEELVPNLWNGKYRGQTQKWFALEFTGEDGDINIETKNPEFLAWRWEKLENIPQLIVPFKRELYTQLVAEFAYLRASS